VVAADTPSMLDRTRAALQGFARDTVVPRRALWRESTDVRTMRERKQGRAGYTLAEALIIRNRLAPNAGRTRWGRCLTGMNPKDYRGDWMQGGQCPV
jgi:hypothetical protein